MCNRYYKLVKRINSMLVLFNIEKEMNISYVTSLHFTSYKSLIQIYHVRHHISC